MFDQYFLRIFLAVQETPKFLPSENLDLLLKIISMTIFFKFFTQFENTTCGCGVAQIRVLRSCASAGCMAGPSLNPGYPREALYPAGSTEESRVDLSKYINEFFV